MPQKAPCQAQTPHPCAALPLYGSRQELLKRTSTLSLSPILAVLH